MKRKLCLKEEQINVKYEEIMTGPSWGFENDSKAPCVTNWREETDTWISKNESKFEIRVPRDRNSE